MIPSAVFKQAPTTPALYVLLAGPSGNTDRIYVGVTGNLRTRLQQHFVNRDSSITIESAPARLNPDRISRVEWWLDDCFSDRIKLEAAELVAFEHFQPVLSSRGRQRRKAVRLAEDPAFSQTIRDLLSRPADNILVLPSPEDTLTRIARLERKVAALEAALSKEGH